MFRRRALQAAFARLALAAMLALVVLPTLGRLHPQTAAFEALSEAEAPMCRVRLPGTPALPAPDRPQAPHAGDDCAYCPLLAALATPTVATWRPLLPTQQPVPARTASPRSVVALAIGHLGPRGPPARVA
jgi:hypothetical protein